ncbi:choice-of-anchor J domain-containing protein [Hymenobacter sp. BT664]|uniref:Choice-of-anchor J domain-containing protein n=1 Tax=Hymenobacter montanus TaxID=2771359 RepID=A0A927BDE0_9BACT|nr:choice-of-anchor J domain-containing protein [Hymenobacter montanus]MBD2768109.1 choice-of-anchor J domain-containing protein [Hymenobacter montanus]
MINKLLLLGLAGGLTLAATTTRAQATLDTSPYTETFDNLASGLPTGFGVYIGATASSLGSAPTAAQLILTPGSTTTWGATGAGFKNFASATGLTATASTANQTAATNRALGVRQTGTFGDPGAAFVFQAANTTGKTDFALSFKLQSLDNSSTRTTTWRVDYGRGATPTAFTTVGTGSDTGASAFSNNTITVSLGSALDNQSGPVYIRIVTLSASTGAGSRPSTAIDDFSLTWNSPTPTTPTLTVAPNAINFGNQNITTTSAAQTYSLAGANLTSATTVTATGPFTVSKDNTTFSSTLSFTPAELATAQTVNVKFTPTATGPATGSLTHQSTGAVTRTVALTGVGTDPNQTTFNFATCTTALSDGWSQYSVTGPQTWGCTTFGRDPSSPTASSPNGVQINGYASGNIENEDWFISPAFNLTSYAYPLLSFWSRTAFNGPGLKLRVSTNYSGTGAPTAAIWTDLNVPFPATGSDVWTSTAAINLAAFRGANVHVAFVYTSTSAAAARWTLDDIALTNSATPPAPTVLTNVSRLAFGYQAVNTNADQPLTVSANDLTANVTLTSSNPSFTLSKDGTTFASTLALTTAEVNATSKTVTVRFRPTTTLTSVSGTVTVSTAGATSASVTLSGDTYDPAKTLEVVNWNIEWFGSADPTLGPPNKDLQKTNVTTVLGALRADVYALAEIVDTLRLKDVAARLSTNLGLPYAYRIADYGSYADNKDDPDYVGTQKLGFIYRTDVVRNPSFQGLLRCTQAQNCPAFTPWASGRFPYLMSADVLLDGVTRRVNFIVIHAKANSTATSANDYARRKAGADLLKNLLDTSYSNDNNLIVGDYNDVLEGTIATGVTPPVSSYYSFMQDASYLPITLPLAQAGLQSTSGFRTVIDNVIANGRMAQYYINGTAAIRTDVTSTIANYASTTSDHYPVFTRYSLAGPVLASKAARSVSLGLYPNPATNSLRFDVPETGANLSLHVYTTTGRLVFKSTGSVEQLNQQLSQHVAGLATGLYLVRVVGAQQTYTNRFQKQ